MKLYEQLKLINKNTSIVVKCSYEGVYSGRVEVEEYSKILHDGKLCDMDFVKFLDAMYDEVDEIRPNGRQILIKCHHEWVKGE
jgi:hypothetical protein